jgi:dephospho-CoA kinase
MRRTVFADPDKRRELEAILHPMIRESALARSAGSKAPYVIFVVPLLFETGFDRLVDATVAVDCPESLQIERVVERDRVSEDEARSIIASQIDRDERRSRADEIIDSATSIPATRDTVAKLHEAFLARSQNCPDEPGRAE